MSHSKKLQRTRWIVPIVAVITVAVAAGMASADSIDVQGPDNLAQLSPRVVIDSGESSLGEWQLMAYFSSAGECVEIDLPAIGLRRGGGCGHGVVDGSHSIGMQTLFDYQSDVRLVFGLTAAGVQDVEVAGADGSSYGIRTRPTTDALGTPVGVYFAELDLNQGQTEIIARDADGKALERFVVPVQ